MDRSFRNKAVLSDVEGEVPITSNPLTDLNVKMDTLIGIQYSILKLLEAAFEDGLSGRDLTDGEF